MLKIEFFEEDVRLTPKVFPPKDGKPPRTIQQQDAYAYLGGKFPVLMKVQIEEGQPPYAAGIYIPHSSSYSINSYGSLELKKFGQLLVPHELDL